MVFFLKKIYYPVQEVDILYWKIWFKTELKETDYSYLVDFKEFPWTDFGQ